MGSGCWFCPSGRCVVSRGRWRLTSAAGAVWGLWFLPAPRLGHGLWPCWIPSCLLSWAATNLWGPFALITLRLHPPFCLPRPPRGDLPWISPLPISSTLFPAHLMCDGKFEEMVSRQMVDGEFWEFKDFSLWWWAQATFGVHASQMLSQWTSQITPAFSWQFCFFPMLLGSYS